MQGPCPVTKTSVFAPNTGQGQVEGEPPAAAPQGTPSHPELSPWFFFSTPCRQPETDRRRVQRYKKASPKPFQTVGSLQASLFK